MSDEHNDIKLKEIDLKNSVINSTPIYFHWENINVYTEPNNGFIRSKIPCLPKKKLESKHILKDVNGIAKPGSLIAIMGASGAGKTTLLNILNFRNRGKLLITGDVKINGKRVKTSGALSAISGYVQQEDLFVGYLKVKEQLKFQSMLRMEKSAPVNERNERVEKIMIDLNLKKCENTLIGIPALDIKGISGGERRRLAFACELITNPNLLFADEPTSGLDSFMAMSVVECMRDLANQGKTIICTIHQPSSEVFQKFDRLCLLSEGRLAYIGNTNEANNFFAAQGLSVPENFNPADFFINKLALVPTEMEKSKENVNKICDSFKSTDLNKTLENELKEANSLKSDPNFSVDLNEKIGFQNYKTNFFTQLRWLLWRGFFITIRDPFTTKISLIQTIFIATLLGFIYFRLSYDQAGLQNMNGVIFILIVNTSFSNLFPVINSFAPEITIFVREHQNGMYSVIAYYLSKTLIELPKYIILPFLFTLIIYFLSNLNNGAERFFICCLVIIIVCNISISFGYFLSSVSPSVDAALALSAPLITPLMIFSGVFLNNNSTPVYFIWIKYISWIYYANELLNLNQWDNINSISCNSVSSTNCFNNGAAWLSYQSYSSSNFVIDFIALVLLMTKWKLLTLIALYFRSYKK